MGSCSAEDLILASVTGGEAAARGGTGLARALVDSGVMSDAEAQRIASVLRELSLECGKCGQNVAAGQAGEDTSPRCPDCDATLQLPVHLVAGAEDVTAVPGGENGEDETVVPASTPSGARSQESFDELVGQMLGPYQVETLLGEGGMGAVFAATHAVLKRRTALKVLPADLSAEKHRVKRFLREAESMAQVRHDNIVAIHNVGSEAGYYFIEMEMVEGGTLSDRLAGFSAEQPMAIADASALLKQAAAGLAAAHERGIVHRDIKPENILLDRGGVPKIADFGLAKALDVEGAEVVTGERAVQGTPAYMSPEQCRGEPADARSDVYSLGIVFFEMLTGRRPVEGKQPMTIILRRLKDEAPSPQQFRPELSLSLSNVVERMLAKDPAERYQHAGEVIAALDAVERGEEIAYTARRIRLRRARILVATICLLVLGAGGGILWQQLQGTTQVKIIREGESKGDAIRRLAREAEAAVRGGDAVAARSKLAELETLAPNHPALSLGGRLDQREAAYGAWRNGDLSRARSMAEELQAADAEDPHAARLLRMVEALERTQAALRAGDPAAAATAAGEVLDLDAANEPAARIRNGLQLLASATQAFESGDAEEAVTQARAAGPLLPGYAGAAGLAGRAESSLRNAITTALAAGDLPAAQAAATSLSRVSATDAAARALIQRVALAQQHFDQAMRTGRELLSAGRGREARREFEAAQAIWRHGEIPPLLQRSDGVQAKADAAVAAAGGRWLDALQALGRAKQLLPDDEGLDDRIEQAESRWCDDRAGQAESAMAAGEYDTAASLAREVLQRRPEHRRARSVRDEAAQRSTTPAGFVFVPPGRYDWPAKDGGRQSAVVAPFYMATHEVTNAEYLAFIADGGYTRDEFWTGVDAAKRAALVDDTGSPGPAEWRDGRYSPGLDDYPVAGVSWVEAAAYAAWKGARLPTESEWVVAAGWDPAARTIRLYPWGEAWSPDRVGYSPATGGTLAPVGMRFGDRSPLGCFDMAGNVMEWTASWWSAEQRHRVLRGGSLHPLAAEILEPERGCRVWRREARADPLTARLPNIGVRLARDVGAR